MPPSRVPITGLPAIVNLSPSAQFPAVQQGVTGWASVGQLLSMVTASGGGGTPFVLHPATTSTLGGIIVGGGLTVSPLGLLSATAQQAYVLPPATGSTLGGIIVGGGLTISPAGVLSAQVTGGGAVGLNNQWTKLEVETLTVPLDITTIQTTGYYTAGDAGDAFYVRTGTSPPSHQAFVRDASGVYFVQYVAPVTWRSLGGKGDGVETILDITNITNEVQAVVTVSSSLSAAGLATGDKVLISDVQGMTEINPEYDDHASNPSKAITVLTDTTFRVNINTTAYGVYTAGGLANFGWIGTDDSTTCFNWLTAAQALGFPAFVGDGVFIIKQTELIQFNHAADVEIYGNRGTSKVIDAHHVAGVRAMWGWGKDGRGADIGTNIIYPADSTISTTSSVQAGRSNILQVNDTSTLFPGEYLALLDTSQRIIYRAGTTTNIINIVKGSPTTITVDIDLTDPRFFPYAPGDGILITDVGGMTEINGEEYPLIAVISDNTFTIDLDSSTFSNYTSGGIVGTGGTAGFVGCPARIQSVDSPTQITLSGPPLFDLTAGTQVGQWNNPVTNISIHDIEFITDIVQHIWSAVSITLRFEAVVGLNIYNCVFDQGTSRQITVSNCIYTSVHDNFFRFIPQIGANGMGIQSQSAYTEVYGNQMEGGLHLVQSGGKTERLATFYLRAQDNQINTNNSSGFDTHWNTYGVEFQDNSINNLNSDYVNISFNDLGSGITLRAWGGGSVRNNYINGRPVGIRLHAGGSFSGAQLSDNVTERCNYSIYANNFNKITIEGHKSLDAYIADFYLLFNTGPAQGYPEFSGMSFRNVVCRGNQGVPAATWQLNGQTLPLTPDRWWFENWDVLDKDYVGFGDAAGIIDQYMGSQSSEPARAYVGPPFPLTVTTGALSATVDSSGVTSGYQIGDIIVPAGGQNGTAKNITGITRATQAVVTLASTSGLSADQRVFITGVSGMTEINDATYSIVEVTNSTHLVLFLDSSLFTAYAGGGTVAPAAVPSSFRVVTAGILDITTGTHPGHGFQAGDVMPLSGGTHTVAAQVTVDTVDGIGGIATLHVSVEGAYSAITDVYNQNVIGTTTHSIGTVANGTYTSATGIIVITLSTPLSSSYAPGAVILDSLTGTGTNLALLNDDWVVSQLAPPVLNVPTTAATGGTLAANTYFYVVTALNGTVETLVSNEQSITTTGATSKVDLSWAAQPEGNASPTTYRVYRGTVSGGENTFYTITAPDRVFTDTGAAGTGGTPPASITMLTLRGPTGKGAITITGGNATGRGNGANFTLATYSPATVTPVHSGAYTVTPTNPAAQESTSGEGLGATLTITYGATLDGEVSPKEVIQLNSGGAAGPIVSLGMGRKIGRIVSANTTYTFTNSATLKCPFNTDLTVTAGSQFAYYADNSDPPICTIWTSQPVQRFGTLAMLTAFPTPPASGLVQEWADDTGRQWRQDATGRNRGFLSETTRLTRAEAQNNSIIFSGTGEFSSVAGTPVAIAVSATNAYTRQVRQLIQASAAIHQSASFEGSYPIFMDDSNRVTFRWGWESAVTGSSMFVGVKPAGDPGTTGPSTLLNAMGVGANTGQTTLHLLHNDGFGTRSSTDLGASFPAFSAATYNELDMWWASTTSGTSATKVWYQLLAFTTATNITTGTFTTSIPSLGALLVPGMWSNNQGVSAQNQFAMMYFQGEPR